MSKATDTQSISRRALLKVGASGLGLAGAFSLSSCRRDRHSRHAAGHPSTIFPFGVASGDHTQNTMVLWTRLAREPIAPAGGMESESIPVMWQIATSPDFFDIKRSGVTWAVPALAHSVHVELSDLPEDFSFFYRFFALNEFSRVGATRTLPADPSEITFIQAACQDYSSGFYHAYRHISQADAHFILHLGDYIYDTHFGDVRGGENDAVPVSLSEYRLRHAIYKLDPDLQSAHAAAPFIFALDNHDCLPSRANGIEQMRRQRAAYQAWYEHQPVRRRDYQPGDAHMKSYRTIELGQLARIHVLDTRQYRSSQKICGSHDASSFGLGVYRPACDRLSRADRSMLGSAQLESFRHQGSRDTARWSVVASSVMFSPLALRHRGQRYVYESGWDSYPVSRSAVQNVMQGWRNTIVLSGDIHAHLTCAIKPSLDELDAPSIGIEFLTGPISSAWITPLNEPIVSNLAHNPHVGLYEAERGFTIHRIGRDRWQATQMQVSNVEQRSGGAISTLAEWEVEDGNPEPNRLK